MSHRHEVIDTQFLEQAASEIRGDLKDDGYDLRQMESQDWPYHFALTKPNMDGTLEFFFGPVARNDSGYHVHYLIVREESRRGHIELPAGSSPSALAEELWERVSKHAIGLLQTSHSPSAEVGPGLLPVEARSSDLSDEKRGESRLADSSR